MPAEPRCSWRRGTPTTSSPGTQRRRRQLDELTGPRADGTFKLVTFDLDDALVDMSRRLYEEATTGAGGVPKVLVSIAAERPVLR